MSRNLRPQLKNRLLSRHNAAMAARSMRQVAVGGKRARVASSARKGPYIAPEIWYEPTDAGTGQYRIVVEPAGAGYRHILTPEEIRQRLAQLPAAMTADLEVVHLARITRKKTTSPCYGMQWGNTIYLYPIEADLVEYFGRSPLPMQRREAKMFGGRWVRDADDCWRLIWTEQGIHDYFLNNVLIHELGHLLDNRNSRYIDRERFADSFAIEHGYKPTRRAQLAERAVRRIVRRHHK